MSINSISPLRALPDNDEILIPSRHMPAYIGLSAQTLARWRHEGKGPEYVKLGRLVAYRAGALRQWLERQRHANTSNIRRAPQ